MDGPSAVDETMLGFQGKCDYSVVIERKPDGVGARLYLWCFELTQAGRPVCYHIIPDLTIPHIGGASVLNMMIKEKPDNATGITLCADSFFTSLGWLKSHPDTNSVFAISKARHESLFDLCAYKLDFNEYRVFSNGNILVSIWFDNKMMICGSTAHKWLPNLEGTLRGYSPVQPEPIISMEGTNTLKQLSIADLQALSSNMGLSQGINFLTSALIYLFYFILL